MPLSLRCAISGARLVAPAKCEACTHLPRCNYDVLRTQVGKSKKCPVAGCEAKVGRTRDVKIDDTLAAKLEAVPSFKETMMNCDCAKCVLIMRPIFWV